jgi:hypothetical protein
MPKSKQDWAQPPLLFFCPLALTKECEKGSFFVPFVPLMFFLPFSSFTEGKQIFHIYKGIRKGSGAKLYMRKGFLIVYNRKGANI